MPLTSIKFYLNLNKQCSFLPKLQIRVETRYENNNGSTENVNLTCFYCVKYNGDT